MSGHDLAPHKTTHERREEETRARLMTQIEACRREVASWPQWMRNIEYVWPQVDALRSRPAREKRQGPRSSRFGNLETMR